MAVERVRIQTYCIEHGPIANRLAQKLAELVARGVRVEFMYDSVGSMNTPLSYFYRLSESGVRVMEYRPLSIPRKNYFIVIKSMFRRNHRKFVVIDSRTYYVGGMNMGERFLDWEDVMARGEGAPAQDLLEIFDRVWEKRKKKGPGPLSIRLSKEVEALEGRPKRNNYPIKRLYVSAIKKARKRVWIAQAYFLPRRKIMKTLIRAAMRGVDVRVVVPARSDVPLVDLASIASIIKLARHGVKVYRYTPAMLHTKMALIDDAWLTVGTANLDSMSLYWNLELNLVIRRRETVEEAATIFGDYFENSIPVDEEAIKHIPLHRRLLGRFLQYYGWIL